METKSVESIPAGRTIGSSMTRAMAVPEIVALILRQTPIATIRLRCRRVCKAWRKISDETVPHLIKQTLEARHTTFDYLDKEPLMKVVNIESENTKEDVKGCQDSSEFSRIAALTPVNIEGDLTFRCPRNVPVIWHLSNVFTDVHFTDGRNQPVELHFDLRHKHGTHTAVSRTQPPTQGRRPQTEATTPFAILAYEITNDPMQEPQYYGWGLDEYLNVRFISLHIPLNIVLCWNGTRRIDVGRSPGLVGPSAVKVASGFANKHQNQPGPSGQARPAVSRQQQLQPSKMASHGPYKYTQGFATPPQPTSILKRTSLASDTGPSGQTRNEHSSPNAQSSYNTHQVTPPSPPASPKPACRPNTVSQTTLTRAYSAPTISLKSPYITNGQRDALLRQERWESAARADPCWARLYMGPADGDIEAMIAYARRDRRPVVTPLGSTCGGIAYPDCTFHLCSTCCRACRVRSLKCVAHGWWPGRADGGPFGNKCSTSCLVLADGRGSRMGMAGQ
ncbi:uncharacterized protein EV422DRAFT_302213 [Fimicolochytrium jonesii]|uniref:uncharacterized protein n=1 Tax=Fimicolochytrium jonesii TaxID=1396493 RepID=UPI0022FE71AF|nr:uncharacterized protein EV422DRAFT_302213 [Fimicolochytrium jonesii]KAI8823979.1 hypothetical protein EV422DRAFT_302213 [Fimicolochytrium jonesii]